MKKTLIILTTLFISHMGLSQATPENLKFYVGFGSHKVLPSYPFIDSIAERGRLSFSVGADIQISNYLRAGLNIYSLNHKKDERETGEIDKIRTQEFGINGVLGIEKQTSGDFVIFPALIFGFGQESITKGHAIIRGRLHAYRDLGLQVRMNYKFIMLQTSMRTHISRIKENRPLEPEVQFMTTVGFLLRQQ